MSCTCQCRPANTATQTASQPGEPTPAPTRSVEERLATIESLLRSLTSH